MSRFKVWLTRIRSLPTLFFLQTKIYLVKNGAWRLQSVLEGAVFSGKTPLHPLLNGAMQAQQALAHHQQQHQLMLLHQRLGSHLQTRDLEQVSPL